MFLFSELETSYQDRLRQGKMIAFWTFVAMAFAGSLFDFIRMDSSGEFFARYVNIPGMVLYAIVIILLLKKKVKVETAFLMASVGIFANSLISQILNENPEFFPFLVLREALFLGLLIPVVAFMGNRYFTYSMTAVYCGTIVFISFYYHNEYLIQSFPLIVGSLCFYAFLVSFLTKRFGKVLEEISLSRKKIKDQMLEIQKLNSTKDKLFSLIAHDIRGPLADIMGSAELLDDYFDTLSEEERRTYAEMLHQSSISLYTLTENLLNWSRLQFRNEASKEQAFSCANEINNTIELFAPYSKRKEVTITLDAPTGECILKVDPEMMIVVLRNLLSNAIKFTSNGGSVDIRVNKDSENISVEIADSGIGIPKEMMDILFDVSEKKRRKGTDGESGTGLGLMLCSEFIEKSGGKIWATSELNVGTSIFFTLPLSSRSR